MSIVCGAKRWGQQVFIALGVFLVVGTVPVGTSWAQVTPPDAGAGAFLGGPPPADGGATMAPELPPPTDGGAGAPSSGVPTVNPSANPVGASSDGALIPAPVPPPVTAAPTGGLALPQIHGFASQGFIKSTHNNYLTESKRGSFEFTEVGMNVTQVLSDRLRTGIQFFAREVGKVGDYRARIDWFYLDYRFFDWLGVRAGRTKMPFGLYNDVADVDAARVPVLLPQAVYPVLNRDILLALTGMEIYGYLTLGGAGALDYRLYGGTLYSDPPAPIPGTTLADFQVPYVVGGRLLWETPLSGLRVGGSAQALRFDTYYQLPATPPSTTPTPLKLGIPFVLWLASIEYMGHDFTFAAEYGRWHADVQTTIGTTMAPTMGVTNERYYAMASYRVASWLTPGAYYSALFPDVEMRSGRERYQHDWAATLRFDLNPYWLLKLEGHFVRGTTDLSPDLNGGTPLNMLARDWFYFLAKTTVYF